MANNLISALQNFSMFMQNRQEATRRMLLYEAEKLQQTRGRQEAYQILEGFKGDVTSPEDMPDATLKAHSLALSSGNPYVLQAFQQAMPLVAGQMATGMEMASQEKMLGQAFETMKGEEMVVNGETITLEEYKRRSGATSYRDFYQLLDKTQGSIAKPVHFFDPATMGKNVNTVTTIPINARGEAGKAQTRQFKVEGGVPMVQENGQWVQDSEGIYASYIQKTADMVDQQLKRQQLQNATAEGLLKGLRYNKELIDLEETENERFWGYKNVEEQVKQKRGLIGDLDSHIRELEFRIGGIVDKIANKDISDKEREILNTYIGMSPSELRGEAGQTYMNQLLTVAGQSKETEGNIRGIGQTATATIYSDLMGGQTGSLLGDIGSNQIPADSSAIKLPADSSKVGTTAVADTTAARTAKKASMEASPVNKLETAKMRTQEIVDFWKNPLAGAAKGYDYSGDAGGKALHFLLTSLESALSDRELARAGKGDITWDKKHLVYSESHDIDREIRDYGLNQVIESIRKVSGDEITAYYKSLQEKNAK